MQGNFREIIVADGFADGLARERDLLLQTEVDRRGANLDGVGTWVYSPRALSILLVEVAELLGIELHADFLCLAWL